MDEGQKRVSFILKLWEMVCGNPISQGWNLCLVGDGPDLPDLKTRAKNLPRLSFCGWKDPFPFYQESSIFLMTSRQGTEGFPMSLTETLACGCVPVVMDNFSALGDIVEDGKNGFATPEGDIPAMAKKILLLMEDSSLRKRMAQRGVESCQKFSEEKIVGKWEALFRGMLHAH
jgi:glycosyltransferase involved in cell wall biosynthesis